MAAHRQQRRQPANLKKINKIIQSEQQRNNEKKYSVGGLHYKIKRVKLFGH
jgi:hypothetical protein